jgi:hypothetical protein
MQEEVLSNFEVLELYFFHNIMFCSAVGDLLSSDSSLALSTAILSVVKHPVQLGSQ